MNVLIFLLKISYCVVPLLAFDILAIFPHQGRSHQTVFGSIVRQLVARGHRVKVIVHYSFNIHSENYTELLLGDVEKSGENFFDLKMLDSPVLVSQVLHPFLLTDLGLKSCHTMLSNAEVRKFMRTEGKFDLILGEFFNSECVLGFVRKFQTPLVGISSGILMPWHGDRLGIPDNPSYVANSHLGQTTRMIFSERLYNFLGTQWYKLVYWWRIPECQNIVEELFEDTFPPFHKMMENVSLLLVNSYFSYAFPRPLVPAIIEIGGVHIDTIRPLPGVSKIIDCLQVEAIRILEKLIPIIQN